LHAVDETLGTVSWDAPLGAPGVTVPTVSTTGWVFVANANGEIHAFNSGGDEQWVQSYPGVSTGLVAGGSNDLYFATADGTVYGLDGATGSLEWSVAAPGPIEGSTPSLASGGSLRLGTLGGELIEIDPYDATPAALVLYAGDSAIVTQPASGSGGKTVFTDHSGRAVCLDSGGVVQWTHATGVAGRIEVSLAPNGNVYLSTAWGELIELGQ
jgi:outer membrane protein assembly factor BamB